MFTLRIRGDYGALLGTKILLEHDNYGIAMQRTIGIGMELSSVGAHIEIDFFDGENEKLNVLIFDDGELTALLDNTDGTLDDDGI